MWCRYKKHKTSNSGEQMTITHTNGLAVLTDSKCAVGLVTAASVVLTSSEWPPPTSDSTARPLITLLMTM